MKNAELPRPQPLVTPDSNAQWSHAVLGRLVGFGCDGCGYAYLHPRAGCPRCGAQSVNERSFSGRGEVYSYTIVHNGLDEYEGMAAYALAYVELDEGPRMLTNIVELTSWDQLTVGLEVEVVFDIVSDSAALIRFRPR